MQLSAVDIVVVPDGLTLVDGDGRDLWKSAEETSFVRHWRQLSLTLRRNGSFGATVSSVHP
jgi:hypothetical protein